MTEKSLRLLSVSLMVLMFLTVPLVSGKQQVIETWTLDDRIRWLDSLRHDFKDVKKGDWFEIDMHGSKKWNLKITDPSYNTIVDVKGRNDIETRVDLKDSGTYRVTIEGWDLDWDETVRVTGSIKLVREEKEEEGGIPGFPWEGVMVGLLFGVLEILKVRKGRGV